MQLILGQPRCFLNTVRVCTRLSLVLTFPVSTFPSRAAVEPNALLEIDVGMRSLYVPSLICLEEGNVVGTGFAKS